MPVAAAGIVGQFALVISFVRQAWTSSSLRTFANIRPATPACAHTHAR